MSERLSSFFDAARWLAALAVVIAHVRHIVLQDYVAVADQTLLIKALYFLTGLGHEAVIVFFVISGYLVGGLTLQRLERRGFDLADYAIHRFSRIYIVLVPALLVGGGLDLVGLYWWNASAIYSGPAANGSTNFVAADNFGWLTVLGNLMMTEGFLVPRLGSNTPLWSLVYEWWYYCIFAAALAGFTLKSGWGRVLSIAALVVMGVLMPGQILLWGSIWLLGAASCWYIGKGLPRPNRWIGLMVLAAALIVVRLSHSSEAEAQPNTLAQFLYDAGLGLAFCVAIAGFSGPGPAPPFARLHRWLAGFSFSLYLTHFPMLILLVAIAHDRFGVPFQLEPVLGAIGYGVGLVLALVCYGWLFSLPTEARTPRLRAWLCKRLRRAN